MNSVRRYGWRIWPRWPSQPRVMSTLGFTTLDPTVKTEEEKMPAYDLGLFYPVRIGDVFKNRYQTRSKLGFGASSTVWLCRDMQRDRYAALKVYIHSSSADRERDVLKHLASVNSNHPGRTNLRTLLDDFEVNASAGRHQCLVHEPLLTSMLHFQKFFSFTTLTEGMLKGALERIFYALDYLHSEARVVHTDIQPKNIMIAARDESIFSEWDSMETQDPSPRKIIDRDDGNSIIYQSRDFFRKKGLGSVGLPMLCDFGEARIGLEHEGLIQPDVYRAPEVILGMKWTNRVDIWNVGVLIWDLFEDHHLFRGWDKTKYSEAHMLAEMIALFGPPPLEFLKRSEESLKFWDESGNWKSLAEIPNTSLEDSEEFLEGRNKKLFMKFMRKMLRWVPEERASAAELLEDEWMNIPCK